MPTTANNSGIKDAFALNQRRTHGVDAPHRTQTGWLNSEKARGPAVETGRVPTFCPKNT